MVVNYDFAGARHIEGDHSLGAVHRYLQRVGRVERYPRDRESSDDPVFKFQGAGGNVIVFYGFSCFRLRGGAAPPATPLRAGGRFLITVES